MPRALMRLAVVCGVLTIASWAFLLNTGLAMYKDGCYWELSRWPHWKIPYAVDSAVRYTALSIPLIGLFAVMAFVWLSYASRRNTPPRDAPRT